jgi:hypothetical protein
MTAAEMDLDTPLRLHPLTFLEEGEEVTVGRADIDSYGLFPPDGAALVRRLEMGSTPAEAADWYLGEYGETVDIGEFVEVLEDLDLLVKDGDEVATAGAVKWQRLGKALFSPVAWLAYVALVAAAVVEVMRHHDLVPSYQHLFFTRSSLTVLTLGIVLGQLPWMMLHETYHALAGRRLGLNSSFGIGRRFYYIVFETRLDGLVAVPRRKRYLPMLAGMLLDTLVLAILTLAAEALHGATGWAALVDRLLLSMAFGVVLRLVWQFYFFLRTDLYFLAMTVLGCNDLQTTSRQLLANRVNRLVGRHRRLVDESTWTRRDADVARWYSWLVVAGYAFLVGAAITVMIPMALRITQIAVRKMIDHPSATNGVDVSIFLVLNFSELVLAGYLALRAWRRRPQALAPAALTAS